MVAPLAAHGAMAAVGRQAMEERMSEDTKPAPLTAADFEAAVEIAQRARASPHSWSRRGTTALADTIDILLTEASRRRPVVARLVEAGGHVPMCDARRLSEDADGNSCNGGLPCSCGWAAAVRA